MKTTRLLEVSLWLGLFLCSASGSAFAQFGGFPGGGFGNGNGNGNGNGGIGGAAGILIDAEGVVQLRSVRPVSSGALKKQVAKFAEQKLPASLVVESGERVVSLKNLESLLAEHLSAKTEFPIELVCLAGLQRIDSVVFDPDQQDVYITGPAEAFGPDQLGRMVGSQTGRPVLLLEDLITALRAMAAQEQSIGCSIDPTASNMQALQQYLRQNSTPTTTAHVQQRFKTMANVLGQQNITVWGVPDDSHFAVALVEADIRMKRIALGLEPAGIPGIRSHLAMLRPQGNSLQRWWFVPMYEPLETNTQRTIYKLKGQRAKLMAQEEISDQSGRRSDANSTRQSTEKFAQLFTEHFQELADKSVPFAELQNLYDLAVLGALINMEGPRHLGQNPFPLLLSDERFSVPKYTAPKSIASSSTYRAAGAGTILGLVGGVTIDLAPVVRAPRVINEMKSVDFTNVINNKKVFGDRLGEK